MDQFKTSKDRVIVTVCLIMYGGYYILGSFLKESDIRIIFSGGLPLHHVFFSFAMLLSLYIFVAMRMKIVISLLVVITCASMVFENVSYSHQKLVCDGSVLLEDIVFEYERGDILVPFIKEAFVYRQIGDYTSPKEITSYLYEWYNSTNNIENTEYIEDLYEKCSIIRK